MGKDLHTLIRLGKWHVDEKRRVLGALHTREEQILAAIRDMDARLAAEHALVKSNMAMAVTWAAFYRNYLIRREAAEQQLAEVRRQIEVARDDLAESFRELKSYETAQAGRDRREAEERDRKERIFLDEIGLQGYRRRRGEG